jgi:hypothetical protein
MSERGVCVPLKEEDGMILNRKQFARSFWFLILCISYPLTVRAGHCTVGVQSVSGVPGSCNFSDCSPQDCETGCQIFSDERGSWTMYWCDCGDTDPQGPGCCTVVILEMPNTNHASTGGTCVDCSLPGTCTLHSDPSGGFINYTATCD